MNISLACYTPSSRTVSSLGVPQPPGGRGRCRGGLHRLQPEQDPFSAGLHDALRVSGGLEERQDRPGDQGEQL